MNLLKTIGLCLLSISALTIAAPADVPKLNDTIKVDGILDDEAWKSAQEISLGIVTWPQENIEAPVQTIAKYFENGDTLFISFDAQDPEPANIRAFYHDRDQIGRDDQVGIKLDPYNDHKTVFQFFVNPLGVQRDRVENVVNGGSSDAWDGIWESAAQINDSGYTVEMAIPLRNFNFKPEPGKQTWAVEFLRFYPRNERQRISNMPIDRNSDCGPCQMQEIKGFEGVEQGKSLAIVPTLVVAQSESRSIVSATEDGVSFSDWQKETDYEPSLDIKWGISSDIFLNATINPDFSQVEADSAQLGINNNFTLFFPEQRPFFLENQDMFSSIFELVYTRNIGAPDVGAKLTGKSGKHTFGIFAADDIRTTFVVPGNLSSGIAVLDQDSNNAAIRYRYDADDFSLGVLSTFRTSDDYHNYTGSVDLNYRLTPQDRLKSQVVFSDTQYPGWLSDEFCDGDDCESRDIECSFADCIINEQVLRTRSGNGISDMALYVGYDHEERDWYFYTNHRQIGKNHRADLGFESRSDFQKSVIGGGYYWYGDQDNWWTQAQLRSDWDITRNDAGDIIEREYEVVLNFDGPLQSFGEFGCIVSQHVGNRFDESNLRISGNTTMFDRNYCFAYGNLQPASGLFLENDIIYGKQIDFANNRLADRFSIRPAFEYSINKRLRAELRYVYETLDADDAEVFTAHQADLRLKYNHDVRNSVRLSVIYTRIDQNLNNQPALLPEDLPDASFQDLATQLIYSYQINPQTVFFAGYSDYAFEDDRLQDLEKNNRSLFMKFSYAWLM